MELSHKLVLAVPEELWRRMSAIIPPGQRTAWVLEAIKERLEREDDQAQKKGE